MITLRPYQQTDVERIRAAYRAGTRSLLYVAPTGSGKTVLFAHITEGAASKGKRVLVLVHRVELIDQICAALRECAITPIVICPGYRNAGSSNVTVASVMSLVHRLDQIPAADLIICDEAHHMAAGNSWAKIFAAYPKPVLRLGVTATPARLDGHGLGNHFDTLIQGPTVAELSELGFLSPCRVFAPPTVDTSGLRVSHGDYLHGDSDELINRRAITGSALEHYKKHAGGKRALVFAISVKHAEAIAAQFREAGYSSVHLHGGTAAEIRRGCVKDFHEGRLQILASCDLFSEGFDCPGAEVGIMLRPTTSLALYRQQCGRILRPSPGKPFALLLDHVGNSSRHGLPDDPIEWQLSTETVAKVERTSVKICPECFAALPVSAQVCECGHSFALVKKPRRIEERDGELVEVEGVSRRDQANATTLEQLREYAKRKGYHPRWVQHVWAARAAKLHART